MAAATNLTVRISAVDATSQAIDAVSKRLAGITAPATKVTKSLARLSDATGVTRMTKAVTLLGGSAVRAGERMVSTLGPLGTLTAALSAGGMAKMVVDWAKMSQSMSFDAQRIGSNISDLHGLEGSARLAGSSAEAAAGGLRTLQDVMTDTVGGRNNEALVYFRQLGVAFDDGAGHALRATAVLPKLADAISRIKDPSLQARVATQFFGGAAESMLPWLRRGSKGMAEYDAMARQYGVQTEDSARAAGVFRLAQTRLSLAFEGLGNSISEKVSPPLSQMMTFLADLVGRNRALISEKFGSWAERFGQWVEGIDWDKVGTRISSIAESVASITDSLSKGEIGAAWQKFAEMLGFGGASNPSPSRGGVQDFKSITYDDRKPFDDVRDDRGRKMMGYFESQGWTHAQAAGLVANLDRESAFSPNALGDKDKSGNYQAYGLAQWHPDRQADFKAWSGHDIQGSTLDEQMRFVQYELTDGKEKHAGDTLRAAPNAATAAYAVNSDYERPKDVAGENTIRGQAADRYAAMPAPAPTGNVKVDVHIKGLPPGTTAVATTSGAADAGVKVVRAMQ